jgi:hypothetical protein
VVIIRDSRETQGKYHDLIGGYFQNTHNYGKKWSFKAVLRNTIESITNQFFNIIVLYFNKYTEKQFHERMNNQYIILDQNTGEKITCLGFDFIGDWRKNHATKLYVFMKMAKTNKDYFTFSEEKILETMTELFKAKGWTLLEHERIGIEQTVKRLYNLLYLGYDGLS